MKNYNLLSLLDIIGSDISVAILKKLNDEFYVPQIFKEALFKNIHAMKSKKSISIFFNSDNYPNLT